MQVGGFSTMHDHTLQALIAWAQDSAPHMLSDSNTQLATQAMCACDLCAEPFTGVIHHKAHMLVPYAVVSTDP